MAGSIYQPTYTDKNGRKRKSAVWWISYQSGRRRVRESSGATVKGDAEIILARKIAAARPGGPTASESRMVRFEDLAELLREDYRRKGNRTSPERRLTHLTHYFGGMRVVDIQEPEIDRYIGARLKAEAAPATVNREIAALRRMFRLGARARLASHVPSFQMLGETVREGFITEREIARLLRELPAHLRPLIEALYITGWRVQDMLSRNWPDVDFEAGWLRIEGSSTKEKSGRQVPLLPRLRKVLEAQRAVADALEEENGRTVLPVFFYHTLTPNGQGHPGARIGDFRSAWRSACRRAGLPDLRVHDLRRSATRNLIRAGISENVAQKYTGHKTASIFRRYDITSEQDLIESADKLTAFYGNGGKAVKDLSKSRAKSGGRKRRKSLGE